MASKAAPFILALAVAAFPAEAFAQGWRTVGFKTVSAGRDNDTIRLRGNARDRQIRVCAINHPIRLNRLSVRFENGREQRMPVRRQLNAGTCTPPMDLRGQRRNLASIELEYARVRRGAVPLVRVQAR